MRRVLHTVFFCNTLTRWRKRDHFERAFKSFDVKKVARFTDDDINALMAWPDGTIIRNRAKLRAVVQNARVICAMRTDAASGPADDKNRDRIYYADDALLLLLDTPIPFSKTKYL